MEDTPTEKGNRHEREARDILKRVYGAGVEIVDARGNHDPFGFVDLIALSPDEPVRFIQIKTNQFTAKDRRKYRARTRHLPHDHATFEVWVRIDYTGWELYYFEDDEFNLYLEIPSCDTGVARESYWWHRENGDLKP